MSWLPWWHEALTEPTSFRHLYPLDMPVEDKIRTIAQEIYGADGVDFSVPALKRLADIERNGWGKLPVCMAKTQYSFTDDATRLGAPKGFTIHVRDLLPKTGAGFIVALTGAVMTMPGLPPSRQRCGWTWTTPVTRWASPNAPSRRPDRPFAITQLEEFRAGNDAATRGCG